jgi:hypothetical protein
MKLLCVAAVLGSASADRTAAEELFEAARSARSPAEAIPLLERAAEQGLQQAQAMLGLAHAQGHGELRADTAEAIRWFRLAALQGDDDSAHNLVALCEARPGCIGGNARRWLGLSAAQGHAAACFELGNLLLEEDAPQAVALFRRAADAGHAAASFNAGHVLALGRDGIQPDLTAALLFFSRAERAGGKVADDARAALDRLQPRWVAAAEGDPSVEETSRRFEAAAGEGGGFSGGAGGGAGGGVASWREATNAVEARCLTSWHEGAAEWSRFECLYAAHASYENAEAMAALRDAMAAFKQTLVGDSCAVPGGAVSAGGGGGLADGEGGTLLGPMRTYLLLSKLAEGSLALARDDRELRPAAAWHEALARHPLCAAAFATREEEHSCFNDRLGAAVTLRRRAAAAARASAKGGAATAVAGASDTAAAESLVALGHAHGRAATRWASSAQTPRVFWPELRSVPWWDASAFAVAGALEHAWASGGIADDLRRMGVVGTAGQPPAASAIGVDATGAARPVAAQGDRFARIVSSGAPIRGRPGDDAGRAGVWSEMMLFDGTRWVEEPCRLARSLCGVLRRSAEVAGNVTTRDGRALGPQGQVTVFRLQPGAHVLPHVGVTNQRLVLQFPLFGWEGVRFRVADEWRTYHRGSAMVFDDSYEHEVVHGGGAPRLVLYAVLHHPQLGMPVLDEG